ncbi:MAG TPA: hypothetical protein VF175_09315 [Lacipirellula sp.]
MATLLCGVIAVVLAGGSCGCTLSTGRSVSVLSDAWSISMLSSADAATIHTDGSQIVVAPTQLKVDGQLWGAIDAAAKSVEVTVKDGNIQFVADGRLVPRMPR